VVQAGFYGPGGFMNMRGFPVREQANQNVLDPEIAERLWAVSEKLTGISFNFR